MFAFIYVATVGFYYSGERIARNLRKAHLSAIIRQNLAFFDTLGAGEVTNRIASDMAIIQEAITSKVSLSLTAIGTFAAAIIIAFIYVWKSALILSPVFVVMVVAGVIAGGYSVQHHKLSIEISERGSRVAEEAVAFPRHVSAFGIQEFLAMKYLGYQREAEQSGVKAGNSVALLIAWSNAMPCLVNRTTITVAHRLSTIKSADLICVLDQGRIVQTGTHAQLIAAKDLYYDLVCMQDLQ